MLPRGKSRCGPVLGGKQVLRKREQHCWRKRFNKAVTNWQAQKATLQLLMDTELLEGETRTTNSLAQPAERTRRPCQPSGPTQSGRASLAQTPIYAPRKKKNSKKSGLAPPAAGVPRTDNCTLDAGFSPPLPSQYSLAQR